MPALMAAAGLSQAIAAGTSLVIIAALGLTTSFNYALTGLVDWPVAAGFIAGGVGGGALGLLAAQRFGGYRVFMHRLLAAVIALAGGYVVIEALRGA